MGIGFGCASLGSRVSEAAGALALARAFDAGVTWYDVAPSYGDGNAELILGRFLRGRRERVEVCTKVGILPPAPSLPKQLLRPVVRAALSVAPGLRQTVRRHRPAAIKPPLDAAVIMPSLEASLRRLGTTYVDVLALHEAKPDEVVRDDVLRALEAVIASGKALRVSIASSVEAALAGTGTSAVYGAAQLANNPYEPNLARFRSALSPRRAVPTITHTVFGAAGMIDRLAADIVRTPTLQIALADAEYGGTARTQALAFLLDFALAENSSGVVLLSMFGAGHLDAALARLMRMPDAATVRRIAALVPA